MVVVSSLTFVMVASVIMTRQAGYDVVHVGEDNVQTWLRDKTASLTKYLAEIEAKRLEQLEGMTLLIATLTQERFMGYPLIQDDSQVPFRNSLHDNEATRQTNNVYPLSAKNPLPLDWQVIPNVTPQASREAAAEHLGRRFPWYFPFPPKETQSVGNIFADGFGGISTEDAAFVFPGSCDPSPTAPRALGCITTSHSFSSVPPNTTLETIHTKASDYVSPLLKSLYEYHTEVKSIEVHFINHDDARSASVIFPGQHVDGTKSYISAGCNWMNQPNPKQDRRGSPVMSIGTAEQIAKCRPVGTRVSYRDFNALEQDWCSAQALDPDHMYVGDPQYDPYDGFWHFVVGRAIYDPITLQLVACTKIVVSIVEFVGREQDFLEPNRIDMAILRWDSGAVLSATGWEANQTTREQLRPAEIPQLDVNEALVDVMKRRFEQSMEQEGRVREEYFESEQLYGFFYPFPVPKNGDVQFRPQFLLILGKVREEVESYSNALRSLVDQEEEDIILVIVVAGLSSMAAVLVIIYIVALYVTSPLQWMHQVGNQVLNTAGSTNRREFTNNKRNVAFELDRSERDVSNRGDKELPVPKPLKFDVDRMPWTYQYAPRSEITLLVEEFRAMIKQFSGKGTASLIKRDLFEVKNPFDLCEKFEHLYTKRKQTGSKLYFSELQPTDRHTESSNPLSEQAPQPPQVGSQIESFSGRRINVGPNYKEIDAETASLNVQRTFGAFANRRIVLRSPIFWLVLLCVALPLVLCVVGISSYVLVSIYYSLPSLIWPLEDAFTRAEISFVLPLAVLKGSYVSATLNIHLRDLYVANRMAGWIYNGALPLADTFTEMTTSAEKCKHHPIGECPALQGLTCDCDWDDPFAETCSASIMDSRRTQKLFFEGLRDNADTNGNRGFSSFPYDGGSDPPYGASPNTTSFWEDIASTPGAQQRYSTVNTNTTFGRLHATSALSTIMIPLYNYVQGTELDRTWGSFVTFEADGMIAGYSGCSMEHANWAHYQNPPNMTPPTDFCPPEKYG